MFPQTSAQELATLRAQLIDSRAHHALTIAHYQAAQVRFATYEATTRSCIVSLEAALEAKHDTLRNATSAIARLVADFETRIDALRQGKRRVEAQLETAIRHWANAEEDLETARCRRTEDAVAAQNRIASLKAEVAAERVAGLEKLVATEWAQEWSASLWRAKIEEAVEEARWEEREESVRLNGNWVATWRAVRDSAEELRVERDEVRRRVEGLVREVERLRRAVERPGEGRGDTVERIIADSGDETGGSDGADSSWGGSTLVEHDFHTMFYSDVEDDYGSDNSDNSTIYHSAADDILAGDEDGDLSSSYSGSTLFEDGPPAARNSVENHNALSSYSSSTLAGREDTLAVSSRDSTDRGCNAEPPSQRAELTCASCGATRSEIQRLAVPLRGTNRDSFLRRLFYRHDESSSSGSE